MEPLTVTDATWEAVEEPVEELDWRIRVFLSGSGLIDRAMPLVASVGGVNVEGLSGSMFGKSAQGFLADVPPVGAKLVIGYPDTGLIETNIAFPGLPNA